MIYVVFITVRLSYWFVLMYFLSRILPCRLATWQLIFPAFIMTVIMSILQLLEDSVHAPIVTTLYIVALISMPHIIYSGKLMKRLIVFFVFFLLLFLSELIVVLPAFIIVGTDWLDNLLYPVSLFLFGITVLLYIPLGFLVLRIFRRIKIQRFQPFYLLIIILPISHLTIMAYHLNPIRTEIVLFFIAANLISAIVLLRYILSHEKNEQLESELNETRRQVELEQARHKELEIRQDEMAKIRHDFNNQLAAIVQLVRMGEDKAAQEVLDALADEIDHI